MKTTSLILLLAFFLLSCSEKDLIDPLPDKPLITIKSTDNLDRTTDEHWIIISDANGQVLTYSELTKDSTFSTNKPFEGKINITFLKSSPEYKYHGIQTYTSIEPSDTWFIPDNSRVEYPYESIHAGIHIKNTPLNTDNNFFYYSASNAHGSASGGASYSQRQLSIDFSILKQAPKDILLVLNDGILDPTYKWFSEEIFWSPDLYLDYQEDFVPMENILTYSFNNIKSIYVDITAYDEKQLSSYQALNGYRLSEFLYSSQKETQSSFQFKVGYLDGFDYYRTRWSATISGRSCSYIKFGGPPAQFGEELFASDFEITDKAFNSFQFTTKGNFDAASGHWASSEGGGLSWDVHFPIEPSINTVLVDFPSELKEKYPNLSLSNLIYKRSQFTEIIGKEGYDHYIEDVHRNEKGNNIIEKYFISK